MSPCTTQHSCICVFPHVQPVAVAVEADSRAFQLYMGGVMSDPGCGDQLNHGVLVVGYGGLEAGGQLPAPGSVPVDPCKRVRDHLCSVCA